jgi:hypothetical protein
VLYVIKGYPQISQTYVKSEIEAVEGDHDVTIVSRRPANLAYRDHRSFRAIEDPDAIREVVEEIRPDVLHTHYLNQLSVVGPLAEATGIPFTIRSHSFDTLALRRKNLRGRIRERVGWRSPQFRKVAGLRDGLSWLSSELCLGVLAFPFARPFLEAAGVPGDRIIDCFPVVDVGRFSDRSPNGDGVMNTGAAIPKKKMGDFLELAARVTERPFTLYAMGYDVSELARANEGLGSPVRFADPVEPNDMPAEYKRNQWLVYTGDPDLATVGWPMAVAEAQAAGVGVCMPRLRPDLATYVGEGGFLYDSIDEIVPLVRGPVPDDVREAGFVQARRSDIAGHKTLLTDLWERVASRREPAQGH